ncbi:MAG: BatA domain-containing protein [Luteolibacter sp.]
MLTLANPLGLLALLGIPAVLAIHFLQRKAIQLPVSTLFLLERTQRDAATGRRFERIISSVPLWMQLLAVLLLAWLLSEPRYQKPASVQRIALVMDSSASMSVFKQAALDRISTEIPKLQNTAASLEFTVLESIAGRPRIYAGNSFSDLKSSLERWQPSDGLSDPSQSLRLARSLVSREGSVIYVTDTPIEKLPYDARQIAVGEAIENVGFTGVTFATEQGALVWRALVRNYSNREQSRTWTVQTTTGGSEARPFTLDPGALVTLQAAFPADAKNVRIFLSPDRFTLDDVLPIVRPQPKPLTLFSSTSPAFSQLTEKLTRALDSVTSANHADAADLAIATYDPLDPTLPNTNAVVFVEDGTSAGQYLKGGIVAEPHPLLNGLNWQALLIRETIQLPRLPTDQVLLWQDQRPLIFLRDSNGKRQLFFNFDLRLSNAASQPAFIVLLSRFAESIRARKIAPVSENLETLQPISLASAPNLPLTTNATDPSGKTLPNSALRTPHSAPSAPGFLTISQNNTALLTAAVHFGDTREADFSACAKNDPLPAAAKSTIEHNTKPDPLWQLWLLLLLATLLISWKPRTAGVLTGSDSIHTFT